MISADRASVSGGDGRPPTPRRPKGAPRRENEPADARGGAQNGRMPIPPLRPLDVFPVGDAKRPMFAMRDPMGIVSELLAVQPEAFFIASHFDGEADADGVARLVSLRMGGKVDAMVVHSVAQQFSDRGLLLDEKFQEMYAKAREAFAAQPTRAAAHAGGNYPDDASQLTQFLKQVLSLADEQPRFDGDLIGLISPHIDFERGHALYAQAYKPLERAGQFDRIVVLGTSHGPMASSLVPTRKNFETPLGPLATSQSGVDAVLSVLGEECLMDELAHKGEHSIEFQTVFLKMLQPNAEIVPLLCGSLRGCVDDGADPQGNEEVERAVEAVRAARSRDGRTLLVAGADLAHVGPRFGGPELTDGVLDATERGDREALAFASERDASGWFRSITNGGDPRNTCGLSPVYLMLRALERGRGHLLGYQRCEAPDQCVTIGAMAFVEGGSPPPLRSGRILIATE